MMAQYPRFIHPAEVRLPKSLAETPLFNLREVADGIFVGGLVSPLAGIFDTIVVLAGDATDPAYKTARAVYPCTFEDGLPVPSKVLQTAFRAVGEARGLILIHCAEGRSRSVSVAYAVLRKLGFSHEEAFLRVLSPHGPPMSETFNSVR